MDSTILMQTIINGLFVGGIYAAFSIGLTLIYGVMKLINFAHGEFLMIGMYTAYWAFVLAGIDPYLSTILAAVVLFFLGILVQYFLYRPVLKAPLLNQVLVSLGLSTLLLGLAQFFFGAMPATVQVSYTSKAIFLGDLVINIPRLISFVISLLLCLGLFVFIKRSKVGKAIRACSQSGMAASLVGIDLERMNMLAFGLGAALVGFAGASITPFYVMSPTVGQNFSISGFVIVVLGSMGNFVGALISAMIIGLSETFGGFLLGPQLKQIVSLSIFILILLFRPQGLFGRRAR
jgi:branched-chain amino acid transport system permease protein